MKNKVLAFLCVIVLVLSVFTFISCNSNKVSISIYSVSEGREENCKLEFTIDIDYGETFTWKDYIKNLKNNDSGMITLGLYTDQACRIKYNENASVNKDIILYVDRRSIGSSENYCRIDFVYQNEEYSIFRNLDEMLTVNDFTVSAYGKQIEDSILKFYSDSNMENQIDITNKKVSELKQENGIDLGRIVIYVK